MTCQGVEVGMAGPPLSATGSAEGVVCATDGTHSLCDR